ncbi:MAG: glycosyltransferase [Bacteroidales bacterium]
MQILWLNANLLLPLDKGGKLRTWHLMRHLARSHDITYLSFVEPGVARDALDGMREVCRDVVTVPRADVAKGSLAFYADVARYLAAPAPYAVAKYKSPRYAARARELLASARFDLVVCDFLVPAINLPDALPCPAVLFTHNVEAEIWRRHAETADGRLRRFLMRSQWRRMQTFERHTLDRFGLVLTVSEADSETFARLYGPRIASRTFVVKTGVETSYFAPENRAATQPRHLVFTGSMDWIPNEDAMLHFVGEILPLIRRAEPSVTLSIVGRAPTPAVQALAQRAGIQVTGRVDDVRPHIAEAAVYVVPIRIGGGTRLKIFEAMAMGKAVVSTTVGAEGLPVTPGRDLIVEDGPQRFADAVVQLLRDDARRAALGQRARAMVVGAYDWAAVAGDLERALMSFADAGASLGRAASSPSSRAATDRPKPRQSDPSVPLPARAHGEL